MKKALVFLLIFNFFLTYAQTVNVVYQQNVDLSGIQKTPFEHRILLTHANGKSIQKKFLKMSLSDRTTDKNGEAVKAIKIGNDTTFVYKDFTGNVLMSEEKIFTKVFNVSDELNIFSWQIQTDTLTVLKHKCRKATTKFRGREYIAYYAEDIPIADGPAKFNGLPGLILKVSVVDALAIYSVEAIEIRLDQSSKKINIPFESRKMISFQDFKNEYNRKYSELESFSSEQSSGVTIKRGGLELLSNE